MNETEIDFFQVIGAFIGLVVIFYLFAALPTPPKGSDRNPEPTQLQQDAYDLREAARTVKQHGVR